MKNKRKMGNRRHIGGGGNAAAPQPQYEEEVVVGLWDCSRCGRKANSGLEVECPGCGGARDEDVTFYLPQEGQEARLTAPNDLRRAAAAGPEWLCEHCGSSVPADLTVCTNCGAPRGKSDARAVRMYAPGEAPRTGAKPQRAAPPPPQRRPRRPGAVALIVLAFVFLAGYLALRPRAVTATVTELAWSRVIEVEEYRLLQQEGWDPPSDARVTGRDRRVRSYRQVLDHYETATRDVSERVQVGTRTERVQVGTRDNGNGTFSHVYENRSIPVYETRTRRETYQKPVYRQEPVYDTWHHYEIWRWVHDRDVRAAGGPEVAPHWPAVSLKGKQEREGKRTEEYRVTLRGPKERVYQTTLPQERWGSLRVGEARPLRVSAFGKVLEGP